MPLNGWRGIAGYLGRNQSTVKRWAATRDLPVHRPQGSEARKGVPVYAFAHELNAWLRGHADVLLDTGEDPDADHPGLDNGSDQHNGALVAPPRRRRPDRRRVIFGLLGMGLALSSGSLLTWRAHLKNGSDGRAGLRDEARALRVDATYLWQKRTPESLRQAAEQLKQALAIDPDFAATLADLAIVYNLMVEYGVLGAERGYQLSRDAARRAIALDAGSARAYSVLGDITFFHDRDHDRGLTLLARAVKLDPKDATARHWLASALVAAGHYAQAATEIMIARELEPLSRSIMVSQAMVALGQQHPRIARQMLRQLVRNEPAYRSPYRFLAFAELAIGNHPGYLAALEQRFSLTGDAAGLRVTAAGQRGLSSGGADGMAQAMGAAAKEEDDLLKDSYFLAHWHALASAWSESARHLALTPTRQFSYYGIDPAFAEARKDVAFQGRIAAAGIPVIT